MLCGGGCAFQFVQTISFWPIQLVSLIRLPRSNSASTPILGGRIRVEAAAELRVAQLILRRREEVTVEVVAGSNRPRCGRLVAVEAEAASAQRCGSFQDLKMLAPAKFVDLTGVTDTIWE